MNDVRLESPREGVYRFDPNAPDIWGILDSINIFYDAEGNGREGKLTKHIEAFSSESGLDLSLDDILDAYYGNLASSEYYHFSTAFEAFIKDFGFEVECGKRTIKMKVSDILEGKEKSQLSKAILDFINHIRENIRAIPESMKEKLDLRSVENFENSLREVVSDGEVYFFYEYLYDHFGTGVYKRINERRGKSSITDVVRELRGRDLAEKSVNNFVSNYGKVIYGLHKLEDLRNYNIDRLNQFESKLGEVIMSGYLEIFHEPIRGAEGICIETDTDSDTRDSMDEDMRHIISQGDEVDITNAEEFTTRYSGILQSKLIVERVEIRLNFEDEKTFKRSMRKIIKAGDLCLFHSYLIIALGSCFASEIDKSLGKKGLADTFSSHKRTMCNQPETINSFIDSYGGAIFSRLDTLKQYREESRKPIESRINNDNEEKFKDSLKGIIVSGDIKLFRSYLKAELGPKYVDVIAIEAGVDYRRLVNRLHRFTNGASIKLETVDAFLDSCGGAIYMKLQQEKEAKEESKKPIETRINYGGEEVFRESLAELITRGDTDELHSYIKLILGEHFASSIDKEVGESSKHGFAIDVSKLKKGNIKKETISRFCKVYGTALFNGLSERKELLETGKDFQADDLDISDVDKFKRGMTMMILCGKADDLRDYVFLQLGTKTVKAIASNDSRTFREKIAYFMRKKDKIRSSGSAIDTFVETYGEPLFMHFSIKDKL